MQYGMRDGKKKLRKGKFMVGVDFQWNKCASDHVQYQNTRLVVSGPGDYKVKKMDFMDGFEKLTKVIEKDSLRRGENGDKKNEDSHVGDYEGCYDIQHRIENSYIEYFATVNVSTFPLNKEIIFENTGF